MHKMLPAIAVLMGASLASCAVKASPQHALSETSWRFVTIDGESPTSRSAKLVFHADRLGASVGCNHMGGPWRIEEGRLVSGPLVQTEMYCAGPVWNQEQAVNTLLSAAPKIEQDGNRLAIRSSGHFAELEQLSLPLQGS